MQARVRDEHFDAERRPLTALLLVAVAACVMLTSSVASATVMTYTDVPELVEISDVIIRGEVVRRSSSFDERQERIVTHTTFEVETAYMGSTDDQVTIEQWGGTYEGRTTRVPGDATFEVGEEVVVFLRHGPRGGLFLSALAQSKYAIDRNEDGALVSRDMSDLVFVRPDAGRDGRDDSTFRVEGDVRRLASFEAELRSLVYAKRGGDEQ